MTVPIDTTRRMLLRALSALPAVALWPVAIDVRAALFQRHSVQRLGVALWTGAGERLWRPLNNPPRVQTTAYTDSDPKGFGQLQRDRDFDHYQDDGVFYDRRPSVWVEPLDHWGAGEVQLVELPTDDEIHDNIVAYWVPDTEAEAGREWRFDYRLHWVAEESCPPGLAHVTATRLGSPGLPGQQGKRRPGGRKFVIDSTGGPFADMTQR